MNFKLLKHIPNFLTCLNLVCGCIAIVFAAKGQLETAAYFILSGMFFDFTDGMLARLFKAHSEIGKQLDSLSDMVTFGVATSFIIFQLIKESLNNNLLSTEHCALCTVLLPYSAFLIAIFSALRLAKFNIDTRQVDGFIGLPTPANALFFISFPLILNQAEQCWRSFVTSAPIVMIILVIIFSYLLVSPLKMFALKFKNLSWSDNKIRYMFVIISILIILVSAILNLVSVSLPLIVILYILMSLFTQKNN